MFGCSRWREAGSPSPCSQPLPARCHLHARDSSRPAHPMMRANYCTPTQSASNPFSAGYLHCACAGAGEHARAHAAAERAIRRCERLPPHVLPPASSLRVVAAAAPPQGCPSRGGRVARRTLKDHPESEGQAAPTFGRRVPRGFDVQGVGARCSVGLRRGPG